MGPSSETKMGTALDPFLTPFPFSNQKGHAHVVTGSQHGPAESSGYRSATCYPAAHDTARDVTYATTAGSARERQQRTTGRHQRASGKAGKRCPRTRAATATSRTAGPATGHTADPATGRTAGPADGFTAGLAVGSATASSYGWRVVFRCSEEDVMTEPQDGFTPLDPVPSAAFGPDHTSAPVVDPPKVNQKNPPRSTSSVFGKLGNNKKPRSGVRALTLEDKEKIATLYTFGAMGLMPFKQKAAQAMAASAEKCADAWYEMARENDRVRRVILMLIEGGAWGKVLVAHTPIFLALLPDGMMPAQFHGFNEMFSETYSDADESE